MQKTISANLKGILWSINIKNLDLNNDRHYIIHQVLNYGDLSDIKWLFRVYSRQAIKNCFIHQPSKNYNRSTFNFVKNYLLNIKKKLLINDYLKFTPRIIRSKKRKSI